MKFRHKSLIKDVGDVLGTTGRIKVMLTTEGTYPFQQDGESSWCNALVGGLPNVDYVLYSVLTDPKVSQTFTLPKNTQLIKVPLWGTEASNERLILPFSKTYLPKKRTNSLIVQSQLLPLFKGMIQEIFSTDKNSKKFANILYELHIFFKQYDYRSSLKDELVWAAFKDQIYGYTIDPTYKLPEPSVFDLIQSLGWVVRYCTILNTPVPHVDVTHSASAAFCGIPGVLAKLEHKTPFLLTEHDVYLREQYLRINSSNYSPYLKTFFIRCIHSITSLNYFMADQISPVCEYNTRWEKRFGVSSSKIEVIYTGVDKDIFTSNPKEHYNYHPTVVSLARIDPVKDLVTLIKAAAIVKELMPNVRFFNYGAITVPEYYEECLVLRKQLDLEETFIFAGHTNDVPKVLATADVIAFSSITEAFPYSVVEAMMAGKAVVATDVGGVKEAISDCGVLVAPRLHEPMAMAIANLLSNPDLRHSLGLEARKRALNLFTIERTLGLYNAVYLKLMKSTDRPQLLLQLQQQKLLSNKGYALQDLGFWKEAIIQFQQAVEASPKSAAVLVLMTEIAHAYNELGDSEKALLELANIKSLLPKDCSEPVQINVKIANIVDEPTTFALSIPIAEVALRKPSADAFALETIVLEAEKGVLIPLEELEGVLQDDKRVKPQAVSWQLKSQKNHADKGYALMELGFWREAIVQYQKAISFYSNSTAVPVFLTEIAFAYMELGQDDLARDVLDKAELLIQLEGMNLIA